MADLQKVIKGLDCCVKSIEDCECAEDCPYEHECWDGMMYLDLMKDAQDLLKALDPPPPHVLTLKEMAEAGQACEPVFIEDALSNSSHRCYWALALEGVEPPKDQLFRYPGGTLFNAMTCDGSILDGDFYGVDNPLGWRAWSDKPTDELRKAVPWK